MDETIMGATGTSQANPPETPANEPENHVSFTDEQKARIDVLVRQAMGRSGREWRIKAQTLEQENRELTAHLAAVKSGANGVDVDQQIENLHNENKVLRLQLGEKDAKISDATKDVQLIRKDLGLRAATQKVGFVDVDSAVELLNLRVPSSSVLCSLTFGDLHGQP
jgi:hypothetical protein